MALSQVESTVLELESADNAASVTQFRQTITKQGDSSPSLLATSVGTALSAIQAWYEDLGDEARADAVLAARQVTPQQVILAPPDQVLQSIRPPDPRDEGLS